MLHAQAWLPEFISKAGMVHHIQGGHNKVTRLLYPSFWGPSTVVTSAAGAEKWRCPLRSSQSWRFECDCALTPTAFYSDYLWKSVQFMTTRNSHDYDPWLLPLKLVPWLTALLHGILYHFLISCIKVPQKALWTGKKRMQYLFAIYLTVLLILPPSKILEK